MYYSLATLVTIIFVSVLSKDKKAFSFNWMIKVEASKLRKPAFHVKSFVKEMNKKVRTYVCVGSFERTFRPGVDVMITNFSDFYFIAYDLTFAQSYPTVLCFTTHFWLYVTITCNSFCLGHMTLILDISCKHPFNQFNLIGLFSPIIKCLLGHLAGQTFG
jgi:hypothetical protein